jgi:hypothetical protein
MAEASSRDAASSAKRVFGLEFTAEYYRPKREMRLCAKACARWLFTWPRKAAKMPPFIFTIPSFPRGPALMKNVYEVLREREAQLRQVQMEVEALRVVAPLLSEESEAESENGARRAASKSR